MPVKIDIIILSFGKTEELRALTLNGIDSLLASEDPNAIEFNIIVIESNKSLAPYQYPNSKTIYPNDNFGFNKFMNIGINVTCNDYICLCNNDLIYHKHWASEMLNFIKSTEQVVITSPFCKQSHTNFSEIKKPTEGYFGYFAGHCFFTTRKTLKTIGILDEKIVFWYADMDLLEIMKKQNIPHYLVPDSKVTHLNSKSTVGLSELDFLKNTYHPYIYYCYKWKDKSKLLYVLRTLKYTINYLKISLKIL